MGALEVERAALGAVLVNPQSWHVVATLSRDDFLLDSHRKIFGRMSHLAESLRPIGLVTIVNELDCHRELQVVGGAGYVASLMDGLPDRPLDSVKHYVDEVLRYAGLRHILHATDSIRGQADGDPAATIAGLRVRLAEIERDAARFEDGRGARISRIEDIPDPFACPSDEIGWIVQDLIPARGITIIAGEAGAGKTWLALALARALTFGVDFLDRSTRVSPVLYLDKENPLSLVRDRLLALFGGPSGLRPWGLWCADQPPMIGDPRLLEFARQEPVLIVDSMIRFHTADENSATQMAPVMADLRQLATAGATVVVLHHKSKSETSSYRGSSDIVAGADVAFALAKRDELLTLRTIKNRFAAETTVEIRADFVAGTFSLSGTVGRECMPEVDRVADIIRDSPGLSQNEVVKRFGMNRKHAIELLRRNEGTLWRIQEGAKRSKCYYPIQMVPKAVPSGSIRNHLRSSSKDSSMTGSGRREPLGITHAVPVLPPFRGGNREELAYYGA
ncbi:MAG: AAA family ATPase [Candidatus Sulfotelmatobacter sp.]